MSRLRLALPGQRTFIIAAAVAATGLGLAYMAMAGAPTSYLAMNIGALAFGLAIAAGIIVTARAVRLDPGAANVVLAAMLLLTALLGTSADGATRWVALGRLFIQPSLIVLPLLAIGIARAPGVRSIAAAGIAALALALQPDRAMAGALAAGMAALVLVRPGRVSLVVLGLAAAGFMATLLRPDALPAMPYVDQIFYSSFAVHPLAGLAVSLGAVLLVVPAAIGMIRDPDDRAVHAVFGAIWAAIAIAAALGNYPTPVVGYGASAIIGYLLCLPGIPARAPAGRAAERELRAGADADGFDRLSFAR